MRYFLSRQCRDLAGKLAAQKTLCAFDFDGTLAPIVASPDRARMGSATRRLLARLAALYPCIVISGRARGDLAARLDGAGVKRLIGNHGGESRRPAAGTVRQVKGWQSALEPALAALTGVWIENKEASLAVHYRQASDRTAARRRILAAAAQLKRARQIGGKLVVNLVPAEAPNKGQALAAERDRLGCDWILYAGDDDTDEDAFALRGQVVAVRIGPKANSHAGYYLRTQREIDRLLELLIDSRLRRADPGNQC